ncbi:MAG: AtpZ/AtpI family protein [Salinivirgaceae bacterium]|jgi:F0F1-type ATP synthase assembly protein I|nr:AtpZ/AtpI family protein [Salinivirgaceae bacterium]
MVKKTSHRKRKSNKDEKESAVKVYARYSGSAFQFGIIIALFTWGGYELDKWLELSFPVFLAVGLLLGIALGMYVTIKDFIKK